MDLTLLFTAFSAGMVATINPCGFAMLPAYISYFLTAEGKANGLSHVSGENHSTGNDQVATGKTIPLLFRAILIGGITTAGFIVLFASAGTLISLGARALIKTIPWIGLLIGILLVLLGIWVLSGRHLSIPGLVFLKVERNRNLKSFFLFGIAYSLASLTCSLPIFLAVVGSTLTTGGILQALVQFFAYAFGMGFVLVALTISIAFFKGVLIQYLRRLVPYVEKVSAIILLGAGGYIIYYWLSRGRSFMSLGF